MAVAAGASSVIGEYITSCRLKEGVIIKESSNGSGKYRSPSPTHFNIIQEVMGSSLVDYSSERKALHHMWLVHGMATTALMWSAFADIITDIVYRSSPWSGVQLLSSIRKESGLHRDVDLANTRVMSAQKKKARANLLMVHKDQFIVSSTDITQAITTINKRVMQGDLYALWVLLLMVSGCRSGELVFSEFESALTTCSVADEMHWIGQGNAFKSRGSTRETIVKPLLFGVSYTWFSGQVANLRRRVGEFKTPKDCSTRHALKLSMMIKCAFPAQAAFALENERPFGAHFTRTLYCNTAWECLQHNVPFLSKPLFISQILGHSKEDISTSLSYQKIRFNDSVVTIDLRTQIMSSTVDAASSKADDTDDGSTSYAEFALRDGSATVKIPKFTRRKNLPPSVQGNRVKCAIDLLREAGVSVNGCNIKKLGIGASTYTRFKPDGAQLDSRAKKATKPKGEEGVDKEGKTKKKKKKRSRAQSDLSPVEEGGSEEDEAPPPKHAAEKEKKRKKTKRPKEAEGVSKRSRKRPAAIEAPVIDLLDFPDIDPVSPLGDLLPLPLARLERC